ncbi:MAG: hypothetical protein K9J37_09090 [Saprospiraceae bacterium]|nr:hypothetical protein [Saprospiraceae bacterium]MCF8250057.1 hypothetical protein [Saprospiraceae bacterium]MCF8279519.1 hypothetical protein [Bacteroidales bacterium]MCF8311977.1 hypothetical protein [Saprospiraceae bacterium]MCF8440333.1 hypothetical protein [Saprospiraceae bacterium]
MKNSIKIIVVFAVLAASCAPKKDKYEEFADDLCVCMTPMANFQKEITAMFEGGQQDSVMAMMAKGQKIDEDGQACIAALEKKHGKIEGEEAENKAMDALRKVCPEIVALMEESAAPSMNPEDMLEDGEMILPEEMPAAEEEQ